MPGTQRSIAMLALGAVAALCLAAHAADAPSARLARLAADTYEAQLELEPLLETYRRGAGPRQGRFEIVFSPEHRVRERRVHQHTLAQLARIKTEPLNETERLTHRLLGYNAATELEELLQPMEAHGLLGQGGRGIANQLIFLTGLQPLRNAADYAAWNERVRRFPALVEEARKSLDEARKAGITTPAVLVREAIAQWEALVPADGDATRSSLWKAIRRMPADVPEAERTRIEREYRALLESETLPALRAFVAYARDDYLPSARTTDGFGALPGGDRKYRSLVRRYTTTALTPEEIHALGLKEVRRIQTQLLLVANQAGFKGEMKDFGGWIAARPDNYPFATADDVLAYLRGTLESRIVPQLPRLFSRMPKTRFEIQLTEPELAATASASYMRPSDDGSRPGVFRIPVLDAKRRSLHGMRALLAHEGMPGHHFDHGFAAELEVPEFRKAFRTVAFGEGWGLYAESLGHEMGLYDEPLSLMGRYAAELFRAARLVVDTGLHVKGWPRAQAIRYLMEEAGSTEHGATTEIHRYMATPAQSLGYKVGELTLLELRDKAQRALGDRFDIRSFHDAVLAQGHLPLGILRERIDAWIAASAGK